MPQVIAGNPFGAKIDWTTEIANSVQGNVVYFGAAGIPALLAPGNSGEFLQTQGAAANPKWSSGSTLGAFSLIETKALSGTASPITFNTGISGFAYLALIFSLKGSVNNTNMTCTLNNTAGTAYDGAYYNNVTLTPYTGNDSFFLGAGDASNPPSLNGQVIIPVDVDVFTNQKIPLSMQIGKVPNTIVNGAWASADLAADVTRVDILLSSGTFTGTATLYGVRTS